MLLQANETTNKYKIKKLAEYLAFLQTVLYIERRYNKLL